MLFNIATQRYDERPSGTVMFFDWHWLGRHRALLAILFAIIATTGAVQSGLAQRTDEQFRLIRENVLDRSASGQIHLVEIDAKSIAALNSWPWKRHIHGEIVDRLSEAGADVIAFDIDFSATSSLQADHAFGAAIERSNAVVVLPTFIQSSSHDSSVMIENIPIKILRDNAFLASVNVRPDRDGTIRNMEFGTVTAGVARPTMAAFLAETSGDIASKFRIDTSIDPSTIPRYSAVDVIKGKVAPGSLEGKTIFIGATAIELGDRYPMSRHGVQPGVVIQALAAETLLQGDFAVWDYSIALVFAMLAGTAMLSRPTFWRSMLIGGAAIAALPVMPLLPEFLGVGTIDVGPPFYALSAVTLVIGIAHILGRFNYLSLVDAETKLSNRKAIALDLANDDVEYLVVMDIVNFDESIALMNDRAKMSLLDDVVRTLTLGSGATGIYRLGQNRFGWLSKSTDITSLTDSIEGIQAIFASRISVEHENVLVETCFGIAHVPQTDTVIVLQNAILAARQAKTIGTRWFLFSNDLSDRNDYVQKVLGDLDSAIESDDIYLLMQPKWSLRQQRVAGVEALIRWNHRTLGPIAPGEFIPVLEQHNQMAKLTLYIARRCGAVAGLWHKECRDVSVALNISAPLLNDSAFTAALMEQMKTLGEAIKLITFEITESAAITDDETLAASLNMFRAIGVKISIDDYGTGQSTLSYLQKLPADEIKIDQSFIRNLLNSKSDQILVRSTIELGHELGLAVVAEGVEDEATMALLSQYGCDQVQGWHIGRPTSLANIVRQIDDAIERPMLAAG